jgi:hypothetical protein
VERRKSDAPKRLWGRDPAGGKPISTEGLDPGKESGTMVGERAEEAVSPSLMGSGIGSLEPEEVERLWEVFRAIAEAWGSPGTDPALQYSQWLEFVKLRTEQAPSYLAEYRSAVEVLEELTRRYGQGVLRRLLFELGGQTADAATTRLAHVKIYVVDEFIRVWLATGGFRAFGAGNYNGYISGSRFAVQPPYRTLPSSAEAVSSPPAPGPVDSQGDSGGQS